MKVLMITPYPLEHNLRSGGVESAAFTLCSSLVKNNIDLYVVTFNSKVKEKHIENNGNLKLYFYPYPKRFGAVSNLLFMSNRLENIVKEIKPDLIHAQGGLGYGLIKNNELPVVLTLHGIECVGRGRKQLNKYKGIPGAFRKICDRSLISRSIKRANHIISINSYITDYLRSENITENITEINNPVNQEYFDNFSNKQIKTPPYILSCGIIYQRKNYIYAIKLLSRILTDFPALKYYIVGKVGDYQYLKQMRDTIRSLRLENSVIIKESAEEQDLVNLFKYARIFLHTALEETAPVVISQAMASGLCVISACSGGISNMIRHGIDGYIFSHNEVDLIQKSIMNNLDHADNSAIGKNAHYAAVEKYSPDKVAEKTLSVYRSLICSYGQLTYVQKSVQAEIQS